MIDFITTNSISDIFRSVHDDLDNFMVCHLYQTDLNVTSQRTLINRFNVYYKDGMDIEETMEAYASDRKNKFRFVPVAYISEALDKISNNIANRINASIDDEYDSDMDEDDSDELDVQIFCVMEAEMARRFCSYLNKRFRDNETECEAVSLLQYTKMTKLEDLRSTLCAVFNTDFIYAEDPIQFGYVCRQYVEGRF